MQSVQKYIHFLTQLSLPLLALIMFVFSLVLGKMVTEWSLQCSDIHSSLNICTVQAENTAIVWQTNTGSDKSHVSLANEPDED